MDGKSTGEQLVDRIAELSAALYDKGLYTQDIGGGVVNVYANDRCDEEGYLYTLAVSITP